MNHQKSVFSSFHDSCATFVSYGMTLIFGQIGKKIRSNISNCLTVWPQFVYMVAENEEINTKPTEIKSN